MTLALVLSSLVAGLIATTVMLGFLYLPLLWRGVHYDTLASLGGIVTGRSDERSKVIGALLLYLGGLLFALFYGLALVVLTRGELTVPDYTIFASWPVHINVFYVLFGMMMGLAHGAFISLITLFVVTDFHPVQAQREPFPLLLSYLVGHVVYGAVAMLLLSVFVPLFSSGTV